ncbi:MAG: hypothetical protein KAY79_02155 [Nitrospira sp.]|jgi:hypothetical protein|nr:hypothetical protein [Nitrospira sp.]
MTRRHSTRWQLKGWTITVLLAAAFTTGCMHHPGGIAPSTKPLAPGGYIELGKVRGQDCVYHLLGLIPVTGGNEMRNAVEDALRTKPLADALVEVTADGYFQYFILFSRACTQVYGTAVETK